MDSKKLAFVIGLIVLGLGAWGIFMGETQYAGFNMDLLLDMTRIALGGMLILASFGKGAAVKTAFAVFGIVYLGNFLIALISPNMFGALPHEYGAMDNILHVGGGLLGMAVAFFAHPAQRQAVV